jgi:tRNA C32,U32 (ribose-2'-O)-methylase TrmJ
MEFATKEKKETQRIVWKRLVGKGTLTKREAFALIGFFKKLL